MNIDAIIKKLKIETNNNSDIIYRDKTINRRRIVIIFNEPLTSSDKISDFIIRSLNRIEELKIKRKQIPDFIFNNISNFKVTKIENYDEMIFFLNRGFTIILIDNYDKILAFETKSPLQRSISTPITETTVRGSRDAFVEDIQTNIGLIKKRIKSNNLWKKDLYIGKYTKTKVNVLVLKNKVSKKFLNQIINKLLKIDVDGIIDGEVLKNLIEKENKLAFPTTLTTEKPDRVCTSLLEGKIAIIVDNTCYAIVLPAVLNDFFKTAEDNYGKSINVTFTRLLKYTALFIALMGPAIYIALINYNQEIIPSDLLVNFAIQRDGVPFPAFIEAFIMIFSFGIIREADLRVPTNAGGALSIVGALILGEAAVSAGIVSSILIIVVATASICSLPFTEFDLINGIRFYRIVFMLGATFLGIFGVILVFIFYLIKFSSTSSFNTPYLMPLVPFDLSGIKDSFFKSKVKKNNIRYGKIEKSQNYEN